MLPFSFFAAPALDFFSKPLASNANEGKCQRASECDAGEPISVTETVKRVGSVIDLHIDYRSHAVL